MLNFVYVILSDYQAIANANNLTVSFLKSRIPVLDPDTLDKLANVSNSKLPPLPWKPRLSRVASPSKLKVAIAGIVGDKLNNGPSRVENVMTKIEIAIKLRDIWLISVELNKAPILIIRCDHLINSANRVMLYKSVG